MSICPINVYNNSNQANYYNNMLGTDYNQPGLIVALLPARHIPRIYHLQPYAVRGLTAGQALLVGQVVTNCLWPSHCL